MVRLFAALIAVFVFPVSALAQLPAPRHWQIDGVERSALVFAPQKAATVSSPLIFAFHGHGGNMNYAARKFNYQKQWPEAIVVYMDGLPTPGSLTDPQGKLKGWERTAADQNGRDLKFFDAVLVLMNKEYKVDPKRIFATGHSNGGGFTYLLWAERGDTFAAVAPVCAAAGMSITKLKPKPAMHIPGKTDELVRFPMQERTMNAVLRVDQCDSTGLPWRTNGTLVGTIYNSKIGTPFVEVIYPGGHTFPDEAPDMVTRFFKQVTDTADKTAL